MEHSTNYNLFYNIYILIPPNFDDIAKGRFENLTQKYSRLSVQVITLNKTIPNLANFKKTIASSFRLFAPEIFPDMKLLIHLDCDTFIFKDLDYFYDLNMTGLEFRGNLDIDLLCDLKRIGSPDDRYINAGVMLMNLEEMRKDNFLQKAFNFSLKYGKDLRLPIQAIINTISYKKCGLLPPEIGFFNCFTGEDVYKKYFRNKVIKNHFTEDEIHKIINNITISHLILKPWQDNKNVFSKEWGLMALKTDYADEFIKKYQWIRKL